MHGRATLAMEARREVSQQERQPSRRNTSQGVGLILPE